MIHPNNKVLNDWAHWHKTFLAFSSWSTEKTGRSFLMIPAFSYAISSIVFPRMFVCSKSSNVMPVTSGFSITLVASNRPPRPTSKISTSTCSSTMILFNKRNNLGKIRKTHQCQKSKKPRPIWNIIRFILGWGRWAAKYISLSNLHHLVPNGIKVFHKDLLGDHLSIDLKSFTNRLDMRWRVQTYL